MVYLRLFLELKTGSLTHLGNMPQVLSSATARLAKAKVPQTELYMLPAKYPKQGLHCKQVSLIPFFGAPLNIQLGKPKSLAEETQDVSGPASTSSLSRSVAPGHRKILECILCKAPRTASCTRFYQKKENLGTALRSAPPTKRLRQSSTSYIFLLDSWGDRMNTIC